MCFALNLKSLISSYYKTHSLARKVISRYVLVSVVYQVIKKGCKIW